MENKSCFVFSCVVFGLLLQVNGYPLSSENISVENLSSGELASYEIINSTTTSANGTTKDLYVIKAVVYEIGILTEVNDDDNSTDYENNVHEQVDLTFYDTHHNGSHIDLGDIPLPIQTNISGQVLTGIAPVHVGAFSDIQELLHNLPITGSIVNITQSNTSIIKLDTHNTSDPSVILENDDLTKIPIISNSLPLISGENEESIEESPSISVQPLVKH